MFFHLVGACNTERQFLNKHVLLQHLISRNKSENFQDVMSTAKLTTVMMVLTHLCQDLTFLLRVLGFIFQMRVILRKYTFNIYHASKYCCFLKAIVPGILI